MSTELSALKDEIDVIVIGAGPSGALAARLCAATGMQVVLVDKSAFPRYKVCGCCLSKRAITLLEECDLGCIVRQLDAQKLSSIKLGAGRRSIEVPLRGSFVLSRSALDQALSHAAVACGALFLHSVEAKVIPLQPSATDVSSQLVQVQLSTSTEQKVVRAKVVLVADGIAGASLSGLSDMTVEVDSNARVGAGSVSTEAPEFYRRGVIYMAYGTIGYVGLVRLEDGTADIAAALNRSELRNLRSPQAAIRGLWEQCGWPVAADLDFIQFKGTAALTRLRPVPAGHRIFVLGDAASYIEPFTGEGIAWALESAREVLPLAKEAVDDWNPSLIDRWTGIYKSSVGKRQRNTKILTKILRHPLAAAVALNTLSAIPQLGPRVAQLVTGDTTQEELEWRRS